jgi:hypothetical protein
MFAMGGFERLAPDFFKVWLLRSDTSLSTFDEPAGSARQIR